MEGRKCLLKPLRILTLAAIIMLAEVVVARAASTQLPDYGDALSKCILFYEGQRSGKLPPTQRLTWRKDSALRDGSDKGVDLIGGYYDAGDNIKFNFPMAFTTTMLAWSVIEFGKFMGSDLRHAHEAISWATEYFLKTTSIEDTVFVQVGDPNADHSCWERPEDMDTPRTAYAVTRQNPGSEVSAEIAAALAASSIVFKSVDLNYSNMLLQRALKVFEFADKYRGSYSHSLWQWVCPFYCNFNGYQDELIWAAAWLYKATSLNYYWDYVTKNMPKEASFEFGWDAKDAGITVLVSKLASDRDSYYGTFVQNANKFIFSQLAAPPSSSDSTYDSVVENASEFICSLLPESPSKSVTYSPGGLLFKPGGSNMQHSTTLSFLLLVYAGYLMQWGNQLYCDNNIVINPQRLIDLAQRQVNYILGDNPKNMSYMVGYGNKYPKRIHHRGSSLPSISVNPHRMRCNDGNPYYQSNNPNPNLLIGAVVGGPDINDAFFDSRPDFVQSEPTTYINAPLVGLLAYFKAHT